MVGAEDLKLPGLGLPRKDPDGTLRWGEAAGGPFSAAAPVPPSGLPGWVPWAVASCVAMCMVSVACAVAAVCVALLK